MSTQEIDSLASADRSHAPKRDAHRTTVNRSPYVTLAGFVFGAATQLFFLWTAVQFFLFLRYGGHSTGEFSLVGDLSWAMFFALPHAVL